MTSLIDALIPRIQAPWEVPVREWREKHPGGRVVGCFPVYSPVELIHAAGCFPVGLFGGGTQVELANADARFVSFVCSIAKSTLELGFQKKLAPFDAVFFHSICDVARNLSSVFKRNFPELWVEYLHLPQHGATPEAIEYYRAELGRVRTKLEEWTGRRISDEALRESIRRYNSCRWLLQRLYAYRRECPEKIGVVEAAVLARAFTCQDPEVSRAQLQSVVDSVPQRSAPRRDRVRVLLEGSFCEQPPLELLQTMEEAGCAIVDDDLVRGWRWFGERVPETGDPLQNLAESYLTRSVPTSVRHDWRRRRDRALIERVRETRAQAVVFCIAKFCEPALFDYVPYKEELERERIPHLLIEFEEKMWTFERVRDEVETFVESILFEEA